MPWQGQKDNMIDRFDGRAHLDIIPDYNSSSDNLSISSTEKSKEKREQRALNYERYRILVQNDFLKIPEERFLRTIELEEQFGGKTYQATKAKEDKKKIKKEGKIGAAIGFNYDQEDDLREQDFGNSSYSKNGEFANPLSNIEKEPSGVGFESENINPVEEDSEEDSDLDLDLTVDIMALNPEQRTEINSKGKTYGLGKEDFIKSLAKDIEEAAEMKHAKEKEEEKAMFSGRKSRRERRIIREKQLAGRKLSPPSYAVSNSNEADAKLSCDKDDSASSDSDSDSSKRSSESSDEVSSKFGRLKRRKRKHESRKSKLSGKISKVEFITTFGGSGPESEEVDDRENDKEKQQSAKRHEAQMKLKTLRRNESPPPIIGPLLPSDIANESTEKLLEEIDKPGMHKNRNKSNNYRSATKRRSISRSPLNDKSRRRNEDRRGYRRSRSRGRYSRSPRHNRECSSRRRSSSRGRSRSPRRKHRHRSRTRSRSRYSRSRSTNREYIKRRKDRERSAERSTHIETNKSRIRMKSRSSSPSQITAYATQNGSKSRHSPINAVKEEKRSIIENKNSKEESSSDSSSSEDEAPNKYRSKYRNKRRSSSSSDEEKEAPAKNSNGNQSALASENASDYEANRSLEKSTDSPLVRAKKMLALSTAKENGNYLKN